MNLISEFSGLLLCIIGDQLLHIWLYSPKTAWTKHNDKYRCSCTEEQSNYNKTKSRCPVQNLINHHIALVYKKNQESKNDQYEQNYVRHIYPQTDTQTDTHAHSFLIIHYNTSTQFYH